MRRSPARAATHPSREFRASGPPAPLLASEAESKRGAGSPGSSSPPSPAAALDRLAAQIALYRQEFERFCSGDRPRAPDDLRARIEADLRELRNHGTRTVQDGFRLSNLEAQFSSYGELFNRRLREREEGRRGPAARRPARTGEATAGPPEPAAAQAAAEDPRRGVTVAGDQAPSRAVVERLFRDLYPAGGQPVDSPAGSPPDRPAVDLERFGRYLAEQAQSIRQRTGCDAVQFRVAVEGGRAKLKARPVGSGS